MVTELRLLLGLGVLEVRPGFSVEQDETAWFTQGKNGVS